VRYGRRQQGEQSQPGDASDAANASDAADAPERSTPHGAFVPRHDVLPQNGAKTAP
jgi:hypothetical protein